MISVLTFSFFANFVMDAALTPDILCRSFFFRSLSMRSFQIEKKVPEKGDENRFTTSPVASTTVKLKKRSPRKGTKTAYFNRRFCCYFLEKKVPEKGDENEERSLHRHVRSFEKKVPEKGDENRLAFHNVARTVHVEKKVPEKGDENYFFASNAMIASN